ncbi:MAG: NTP transferase domain-containing protein [Candidatus Omnitrophica bacterium]|nr:NTP transferase domain-containing protein [Candidatus Omnitrophota bacterium]
MQKKEKRNKIKETLYGLVLAGGRSSRMKRDKSLINYYGKSQTEHCFDLLSRCCQRVFVSNRENQSDLPGHKGLPQIQDTYDKIGPLGGILSAMAKYPDAAWLVLACDLPFVDQQALNALIKHRDKKKFVTAYKSTKDGLPEPLCAIYEADSGSLLLKFLKEGTTCPRKILMNLDVCLIKQGKEGSLENINNEEEYQSVCAAIKTKDFRKKEIQLSYFACIRESRGLSEESLQTDAVTAGDLYAQLQDRYGFDLTQASLKVAINDKFSSWQTELKTGDRITFIPPVCGG